MGDPMGHPVLRVRRLCGCEMRTVSSGGLRGKLGACTSWPAGLPMCQPRLPSPRVGARIKCSKGTATLSETRCT